jgi:predicted transcriptional regulator
LDFICAKLARMKIPNKQEKRVTFRLPDKLHKELQEAAERNCVALNAEVIARLHSASVLDRLEKQAAEIAELKSMMRELLDKT